MTGRTIWSLLLTLALALALPLAVAAWLAGGHVTPEQAAGHAVAVLRQGAHQHAPTVNPAAAEPGPSTHLVATARASLVNGPFLTIHAPTGLFALWQALIASGVLLGGLLGWRRRRAQPAPRPASHIGAIPLPPPRRPRLAPV